jgi:4,5:9,10-diseco-3-hydroxy-5,9,17-trioxoandrosta-1(10),2-diene-4-oate hydrolase
MATASSATPSAADLDAYGAQGRSPWLDVDWREHRRRVRVGGGLVNVVEMGAGDPIVFIHGLGGGWQNWLEQLPVFARDHRVIAFDLPGFGQSEMPAEKISIKGYGRFVDELLGVLEVQHGAAIVGNSMGGFIGAELAIQFPSRVERLVLVSAAGLTVEYQRNEHLLLLLRRIERRTNAWGLWLGAHSEELIRRRRSRRALLGIVAAHPEQLPLPIAAEQLRGAGSPGFVDALDALTDYPIRDRLGRISCPTLIVWGQDDRLVPVRDAFEFERLIPNARKVIYRDTGHVAMIERPAAFNALLAGFLAEEPGSVGERGGDEPGPELSEAEARAQAADPAD